MATGLEAPLAQLEPEEPQSPRSLQDIFGAFCPSGRSQMDASCFSKLCRDCRLVDTKLSDIMVDLIYLQVQQQGARSIGYDQFVAAMEEIALKKGTTAEDVISQIKAQGAPAAEDNKPAPPSWWNSTLLKSTPEKAADAAKKLMRRRVTAPDPNAIPLLKLSTLTGEVMRQHPKQPPTSPDTPMDLRSPDASEGSPMPPELEGDWEYEEEGEAAEDNWRDNSMENVRRTYISYCLRTLQSMAPGAKQAAVNSGALRYFNGTVLEGEGQGLMDHTAFSRLCKDHGLFDSKFHSGEGDVLFETYKDKVTRRICFNEFVLIIKAFARRKGVEEEELFKQICFGAGPMSKPNPEEAAAEKGRSLEVLPIGRITPSYARAIRSVRHSGVSASVDNADKLRAMAVTPSLRRSRSLTDDVALSLPEQPERRRPSTSLAPAQMDLTQEMRAKVRAVFGRYCGSRGDNGAVWGRSAAAKQAGPMMDSTAFARLCKDCRFVGTLLPIGVVDNIFCRAKAPGVRKIGFSQFLHAVRMVAMEKVVDVDEVLTAIALKEQRPVSSGGQESAPGLAEVAGLAQSVAQPLSLSRAMGRRRHTTTNDNMSYGEAAQQAVKEYQARVLDPAAQGALVHAFLHWALEATHESGQYITVDGSGIARLRQPDLALMDNSAFVRFCRDVQLMDGPFSGVDLLFTSIKDKGARKISFTQFKNALVTVAQRRSETLAELVESVLPRAREHYVQGRQ